MPSLGVAYLGKPLSKSQALIAVVDDEDPVRRALKRLLRSAGLEVETFASGVEFLNSLGRGLPDCVVLDLHMARLNGFEVQARLAGAGLRVPVVVITGHDTPENRRRVIDAGASAYLRKPVDDQALLDAVTAAIGGGKGGGAGSGSANGSGSGSGSNSESASGSGSP